MTAVTENQGVPKPLRKRDCAPVSILEMPGHLNRGGAKAMDKFHTLATATVSRLILSIAFACLIMQPSFGDAGDKVLGAWKLESLEVEVQTTGQKEPVMGANPTGYVVFTPERRVFFILTGEARKPAKTDQERAALLNTLVAYTGTYRVEGDTWITNVEVAWNPAWVGTEQARSFTLDGKRLQVLTPWRVMPNWAEKGMTRTILTFVQSK